LQKLQKLQIKYGRQKAESMIRFLINKDTMGLTWEEYETIELAQEGNVKLRNLRPLVARFMVDEASKPLPHKAAMAELGKLPLDEINDVFTKFADAMRDTAIPKANGTLSAQPSEPVSPPSESPIGSQP
jgi:hypothetical protein